MKKCINHKMFKRAFYLVNLILIFSLLSTNFSFGDVVKKIEIIGNERIPEETIKMFSGIKLNNNLNPNDVNNIIKDLYSTNFFKKIEIKFIDNNLQIFVTENPIISDIKITGLKAKKIKEAVSSVLSIREKSSFNEIILINEKDKILNALKDLGYVFASVDILKEELNENKLNLIINIDLGEKAKIKKSHLLETKSLKIKN